MADTESSLAATAEDNRIKLSACGEYQTYTCDEQSCWATASFKAPVYEPTARPSVDIVAVIDKSGSMSGVKLDLVKKTLLFVIDQLKECDRMSLVTYDSYVQLVFGLMKMDKANKERCKSTVESIVDGSSTNLCGGLIKGMEQIGLTHGGEKAQVQSVLLLTDGLANQGISSKEGILAEMKKMQDQGLHAVSIPQDAPSMDDVFGLHFGPPQMQNRRAQRGPPIQFQNRGLFGLPVQQGPATPHVGQLQQPNVVQIPTQQQASSPSPIPQLQTSNLLGGSVQQGPPPPPVQQLQLTPPPPPVPQLQTANIVQVPIQQQMGISALPPPPAPHTVQQQPATDTTKSVPPGAKFEGTVYTFGFGSDHDATLLEAISTQGGGVYYYIDSNEKIPESFADCLGGLLSVMGQNLSLKLEVVGENSITAAHANRTVNWTTPNKSCEIPMGDLQSEEERDIVLEIKLPSVTSPQQDTVLKTTLSYFNVITSEFDIVQSDLILSRGDGDQGAPSHNVDIQRNRILATAALKEAEPLADQGKLQEAQKVLKETITTIEKSLTAKETFCQALIGDLKKSLQSMQSRQSYLGHGKLYMHSKMQTHSVQRSNFVDSNVYYQNASKVSYRLKSKK